MRRLVLVAAALWLAACSKSEPACDLPAHVDDLEVLSGEAQTFPAEPFQVTDVGTDHVLVCGDGFAATWRRGATPQVLSQGALAGACGGVAASGTRAVVTTRAGQVVLLDVTDPDGAPVVLAATASSAATLYGVAIDGQTAWVAAGPAGVLPYDITGDNLVEGAPLGGATDARDVVALGGTAVLVADGFLPGIVSDPSSGGAELRVLAKSDGSPVAELTGGMPGMATRLATSSSRTVALRPGYGFDVLDATESSLSVLYSVAISAGIPFDLALDGDQLFVATGSQLHRYALSDTSATLVSSEDRAGWGQLDAPWFRSVARTAAGELMVLTNETLFPVTVGAGEPAPEIFVQQSTFTLAQGQVDALYRLENLGEADLIIAGVETDAPFVAGVYTDLATPRDGCSGQFVVEPGGFMLIEERVEGVSTHVTGEIRIRSNDPDEADLAVIAEANRPVPAVGETIDNFHLATLDGGHFSLSETSGKVILAKLYDPT